MTPIPTVTDLDMAFPTRWKELLPKWEELTDDEKAGRGLFCKVAQAIAAGQDTLDIDGKEFEPKPGIDINLVGRYLRATLGDYGPSHEHKIGGVAHRLAEWYDVIDKVPA